MLHNANNFKQRVLNQFGITHIKVRTKPWFLVAIDNDHIKRILEPYNPHPLMAKVKDYTHYICIGPEADEATLLSLLTVKTSDCPTWWHHAQRWLDQHNYTYEADKQRVLVDGTVFIRVKILSGDTNRLPIQAEGNIYLFRVPRYVSTNYAVTGSLKTYVISSLLYYAFNKDRANFEKALLTYVKHFVVTPTAVTDEKIDKLMNLLTTRPADVGVDNWRGPEETVIISITD